MQMLQFRNYVQFSSASRIASIDCKKLKDGGLCKLNLLHTLLGKNYFIRKGIVEAKVDKIIEAASKLVRLSFTSANQLHAEKQEIIQITSGSRELYKVLEGNTHLTWGIETGSITELYGELCSEKAQLCHTLYEGGAEGKAMYIDTEGTSRSQKLADYGQPTYNTKRKSKLLLEAAPMMVETRLALLKGRAEERICKVISSLTEARFQISAEGVTDCKDRVFLLHQIR
ncbi:hypothetical protein MKW98_011994 [Papaver atlanticum]|uniref:Rad51-like C-terminal domain-containing protein n=1 Tax=Papaver atlanticum TaxID=357466 RepID=A0AAD4SMT1_9MAGN|nr:hypothetical protein MKW98_011994 [Papaver atlanticum]